MKTNNVEEKAQGLYRNLVDEQNKKNRIYISGPITGTDDFMTRFSRKEEELKERGYSVLNPANASSYMPEDTTHQEYMRLSFLLLDMCDRIYMMKGWKNSRGANQEYGYALAKGKTIVIE